MPEAASRDAPENPFAWGRLPPVWVPGAEAWAEPFASRSADAAGLEFPGEMQKAAKNLSVSGVCYWKLLVQREKPFS